MVYYGDNTDYIRYLCNGFMWEVIVEITDFYRYIHKYFEILYFVRYFIKINKEKTIEKFQQLSFCTIGRQNMI